jgi:hypothetical protein
MRLRVAYAASVVLIDSNPHRVGAGGKIEQIARDVIGLVVALFGL